MTGSALCCVAPLLYAASSSGSMEKDVENHVPFFRNSLYSLSIFGSL